MREAVEAHLDELEYGYQLRGAAEAIRRGEVETISSAELAAELFRCPGRFATAPSREGHAEGRQASRRRISDALERLATLDEPTTSCKALTGPLAGLWRLRVGDYRVILDIRRDEFVIVALGLGHRSPGLSACP